MRISIILSVTLFIFFGFVSAKRDCKKKLSQCEIRKPFPRKPVCGTDDRTYPHRCALLRERCSRINSSLTVKYKGRCKGKKECGLCVQLHLTCSLRGCTNEIDYYIVCVRCERNLVCKYNESKEDERRPCWVDRNEKVSNNHANQHEKRREDSDYIPECLSDGMYAPVQCHASMGYCWCVTPHGKMIPRSIMARHQKLECPKRGGKASSTFTNSTDELVNFQKKGCDQTDKNTFVNNLVRIFKTEYNRDAPGKQYDFQANGSTTLENNAIQWKFATLDKDRNNHLIKNEYHDLRKLIKKVVKPRRCSRTFVRLCDNDHNSIISKEEWTECLNTENRDGGDKPMAELPQKSTMEASLAEVRSSSMSESQIDLSHSEFVGKGDVFPLTDHSTANERESEEKANDCMSDRRAVLEELKLGNQEVYVPECTSDGFYKRVQCYPSTGYCWCVLEDSGKPIPGTSVRNSEPNCNSMPQLPRSIKGCPDPKKIAFIRDLMIFFERNLTNTMELNNEGYSSRENQKKLEELALLSFHSLDGNKNDFIDRREWKPFRATMATSKTMKRCGRKFPRYCDSNHDYKITKNEWIQCLNITTTIIPVARSATARNVLRFQPTGQKKSKQVKSAPASVNASEVQSPTNVAGQSLSMLPTSGNAVQTLKPQLIAQQPCEISWDFRRPLAARRATAKIVACS